MSRNLAKVAVLFHRLGPYHLARIEAAARQFSIVAVESSGVDETYAWDKVSDTARFERVTLFEKADALKLPAAEVVARMEAVLDQVKPSVVVIPGWAGAAALGALGWCGRHRIPAIFMSESTAGDAARSYWREAVKRRMVALGSAALVGGTPHQDYMVQLGMPANRVFMGYDAVDNDYFAAQVAKVHGRETEVRQQYQLPEHYFLASARFIQKKNLATLIDAYATYRQLRAKPGAESPAPAVWDLVLLGDGALRPELCQRIASHGLEPHIHLPGFKQYHELPAYYGLAGTFIHASTTEQWGLVVNEAMASRLPVLVSRRCGCAPDLVRDGVNGFGFDPADPGQLAQLMLQVSAPAFPRAAFGTASQTIIADWGPGRFAQGLSQAVSVAQATPPPAFSLLSKWLIGKLSERKASFE